MQGPLDGLRVLDISTIIAGPLAATLLADYGADVVKVELPGRGDGARGFGPFKDGKSLWWKVINRNKQFMTLDLRKPEGAALLLEMISGFDVLIENFRPGVLDGWGLAKEALWAANPSLVILRTTGFGQDGPYSKRPAFARVFEAMGGLTHITGEAEGEPMHSGYPVGDAIGALFGSLGVLAACWKRARHPDAPGEEIDLALYEAVLRILEFLPIEFDQLGEVRGRHGNTNQYSAPSAVFKTADGRWVTLAGSTNVVFAANCRAVGRPELAQDPRFADNPSRTANLEALNKVFGDWIAANDLETVLRRFDEEGGALGPVYSIDQIMVDPQVVARQAVVPVADDDFGSVRMQNVVPRFVQSPGEVRHSARDLGANTDAVLRERLNLPESRLAALRLQGII